jgi:ribonuclease R
VRLPIPPPGLSGTEDYIIKEKNIIKPHAGLVSEIEGIVEGHRDGHGFVWRDDGEPAIYLSPEEMRSVMHRDRVRVRVTRTTARAAPKAACSTSWNAARRRSSAACCSKAGQWVVAPEDRRYGNDILIPKNATATAAAGQVVAVELTEPPSLHSKPVGPRARGAGRDRRPGHGDRDRGAQVRGAAPLHAGNAGAGGSLARAPSRRDRKHRVDLRDVSLVTIDGEDARDFDDAVYCEPFKRGRGKSPSAAGACWWPSPTSATT